MSSHGVSERMLMQRLARLWIFSFPFLQLCNAIPCTVTQDAGGTLYSVPEFHATDCHIFWTNSSGDVLANHKDKMNNLVVSNRSLRTHGCLKEVHYKRDCISEGEVHYAECSINCSEKAEPRSGGDLPTTPAPRSAETKPGPMTAVVPHNHWIVPVVVAVLFLLLLVVLAGVLYYMRSRCHICRADGNTNSVV